MTEDLQAQIRRLKEQIAKAYQEGYSDGYNSGVAGFRRQAVNSWHESMAKRILDEVEAGNGKACAPA